MNKFKNNVIDTFFKIKNEKFNTNLPQKIPVYDGTGLLIAFLKPLTKSTVNNSKQIKLLAKWREENSFAFPTQFKVTLEGTKKWTEGLIKEPSRILFFIETLDIKPRLIGHIGLFTFDFRERSCEIDNVVRGDKKLIKGIMTLALNSLVYWTLYSLKPYKIYLKVLSDNKHAVKFYQKNNFKKVKLIPLKKIVKEGMIIWKEKSNLKKAFRYFLKMRYVEQKN